MRAPAALAILAVVVLVGTAVFGPANWRYGVRHLWAGWLVEDTLPPQHLAVLPGDSTVRRGGDLHVTASAEGFEPSRMEVFAQFQAGARVGKRADGPHGRRQLRFHVLRAARADALLRRGRRAAQPGVRRRRRGSAAHHEPQAHLQLSELDEARAAVVEPGDDIRAVEGTQVTVELVDRPAARGVRARRRRSAHRDADRRTASTRATLEVAKDGEYSRLDAVQRRFREAHGRLSDRGDPRRQARRQGREAGPRLAREQHRGSHGARRGERRLRARSRRGALLGQRRRMADGADRRRRQCRRRPAGALSRGADAAGRGRRSRSR